MDCGRLLYHLCVGLRSIRSVHRSNAAEYHGCVVLRGRGRPSPLLSAAAVSLRRRGQLDLNYWTDHSSSTDPRGSLSCLSRHNSQRQATAAHLGRAVEVRGWANLGLEGDFADRDGQGCWGKVRVGVVTHESAASQSPPVLRTPSPEGGCEERDDSTAAAGGLQDRGRLNPAPPAGPRALGSPSLD